MDRVIVYPGAIPLETDILNAQKNAMIGLAKFTEAIIGTSTQFRGLPCIPTTPASLAVRVGAGEVYALQNVDNSSYSSIPADTAHTIVKQGIRLDASEFSTPAPGTSGHSINYLIQGAFQETDADPLVLSYYNSANPSQAFSGPGNTGTANNTFRRGRCDINIKAGVAATTGTQTTPPPDVGYTGLYVVTVSNGQTEVVAANITAVNGAPFLRGISDVAQVDEDNNFTQPQTMPDAVNGTQAVTARQIQSGELMYGEDTSATGDDYTITLSPAPVSYFDGMEVMFKPTRNNVGACTLNVNGLGAIPIKRIYGGVPADPFDNHIAATRIFPLTYVSNGGTPYFMYTPQSVMTIGGDSSRVFSVAPPTADHHAVPRSVLAGTAPIHTTEAGVSAAGALFDVTNTITAPQNGFVIAIGSVLFEAASTGDDIYLTMDSVDKVLFPSTDIANTSMRRATHAGSHEVVAGQSIVCRYSYRAAAAAGNYYMHLTTFFVPRLY